MMTLLDVLASPAASVVPVGASTVGALLLGVALGALLTWLALRGVHGTRLAAAAGENRALRERVEDLRRAEDEESETAAALAPLREAMTRVERQVGVLERDRVEQFGELGERLAEVGASTAGLLAQTSTLAGSLNSSSIRGAWGETQLRRLLEHAGLLARCDFDEQVSAVSAHDARVRPDVVVRLPGDKVLVIDAKTPMSGFLAAQTIGLPAAERARRLSTHAAALRTHIDALAAKEYWTAFTSTPQMVVCFVPNDAVLAAALRADPALFDHALSRRVVLASPATLMALLRTVAYTWQQDAVTESARELLGLGKELYARLATLGGHVTRMGSSLRRSVESYNAMVGALESRVLVTARRMHELGVADAQPPPLVAVDIPPRPLTASELLDVADDKNARRHRDQLATERALGPDQWAAGD